VSSAPTDGGGSLVVATAPGRLRLTGGAPGARVSVALDRRALCRVETGGTGLTLESKDALTRTTAADAEELLSRAPRSVAAQAIGLAGARGGLRVVTEWKLPQGSGVDGDAALALATTAALARALGREAQPAELLARAREATRRAGLTDEDGHHAALWGGVVLTRGAGGGLAAEALGVDPGRIEEALLLVDPGEDPAGGAEEATRPSGALAESVAAALLAGRCDEIVGLLADEAGASAAAGSAAARVAAIVRGAGGAAWRLGKGRLMAVWAPPGSRGPGRGEAVREALKTAALRPLAIRVDLRGLEID
jgi:hypothetical protein